MSRIITFFMSLFLSFTSIGATIAAGTDHSLFLDSDGNVWSVGSNFYGQLGLGDNINITSPQKIPKLPKIMLPRVGGKSTKSARNICL
jgi:alpha-tubulin suppressor-like RCC1 family protein